MVKSAVVITSSEELVFSRLFELQRKAREESGSQLFQGGVTFLLKAGCPPSVKDSTYSSAFLTIVIPYSFPSVCPG